MKLITKSLQKIIRIMFLIKLVQILLGLAFIFGLNFMAGLYYYKPNLVPSQLWKKDFSYHITDTPDNIFWFVQVSDIHVSRFYDHQRILDLKKFVTTRLDQIQPELVLVTGDLTDAKTKNFLGSKQYKDEWETYQGVINESKVTERYVWLDIRGNHDTFNVISSKSSDSPYSTYSGDKGKLSNHVYTVQKSYGKYSFIHVNATLVPGPKRPFNFLGYLNNEAIKHLDKSASSVKNSNLTVWYSHYPTSTITCNRPTNLRSIVGHYGSVYLCGHLHDLAGLANNLYAVHPNGFLEAELADWKINRMYRIMSIDHDLINFVDVKLDDWPVILITSPIPANYMLPKFQPLHRMKSSSHIRFLIFGSNSYENVKVSIDGKEVEGKPQHVKGPLWVCRWNPQLYTEGPHKIQIDVEDADGGRKSREILINLQSDFSYNISLASVFVLLTDFTTWMPILFFTLMIITISLILILRRFSINLPLKSDRRLFSINPYLFNLHLLLCDDLMFYPIIIYLINVLIGPQIVGELITGYTGICFSYGIFLNGQFHDERQLYANSLIMLIFFFYPVIFYLSRFAEIRWSNKMKFTDCFKTFSMEVVFQVFILIDICFLAYVSINTGKSYGVLAFWLNPQQTWWLFAVIFLIFRLWTVDCIKLKSKLRYHHVQEIKSK